MYMAHKTLASAPKQAHGLTPHKLIALALEVEEGARARCGAETILMLTRSYNLEIVERPPDPLVEPLNLIGMRALGYVDLGSEEVHWCEPESPDT